MRAPLLHALRSGKGIGALVLLLGIAIAVNVSRWEGGMLRGIAFTNISITPPSISAVCGDDTFNGWWKPQPLILPMSSAWEECEDGIEGYCTNCMNDPIDCDSEICDNGKYLCTTDWGNSTLVPCAPSQQPSCNKVGYGLPYPSLCGCNRHGYFRRELNTGVKDLRMEGIGGVTYAAEKFMRHSGVYEANAEDAVMTIGRNRDPHWDGVRGTAIGYLYIPAGGATSEICLSAGAGFGRVTIDGAEVLNSPWSTTQCTTLMLGEDKHTVILHGSHTLWGGSPGLALKDFSPYLFTKDPKNCGSPNSEPPLVVFPPGGSPPPSFCEPNQGKLIELCNIKYPDKSETPDSHQCSPKNLPIS